jgi:hypothetical protein
MKIETEFSCGDQIYVINDKGVRGPWLIGKVGVEYIAPQDGPEPGSIFGNIGRQKESYKETYMCFETGIGSGYVYDAKNCFESRFQAEIELRKRKP